MEDEFIRVTCETGTCVNILDACWPLKPGLTVTDSDPNS